MFYNKSDERSQGKQRPKKMSSTIKSLLNSARDTISGASRTPIEELFPKVDPAVDGDDCDHDCQSCDVKLPRGFKIEEDDELYGFVKGWSTHILVATGKTDWVRDVEDEKGSVMEAFGNSHVKPSNGVSFKFDRTPVASLLLSNPLLKTKFPRSFVATHALSIEYTNAVTSQRLRRTNNCITPSGFHNY